MIRGAPANLERQWTRRQGAGVVNGKDRGDHGFIDTPTKLFFLDVDDIPMAWRDDPEGAIRKILAELGEPWDQTSCVWFFTGTHGLERDKDGRWNGKISDGVLSARIAFITSRALTWGEASALTKIAKVRVPKLDASISNLVQPNYIARPLWIDQPEADPLGDIPTIGRIKGKREALQVPDDLEHRARWAKAQGHNVEIADHPDAISAVRGIGHDGSVRSHLKAAVMHLLIANEPDDVTSFADHAIAVVATLRQMVEANKQEIIANLEPHGRRWSDVTHYLPDNMVDWTHWLLDHPSALKRKTIKLDTEERDDEGTNNITDLREEIYARVERFFDAVNNPNLAEGEEGTPTVKLLVAPTGSRATAVRYVAANPGRSVVILMPRHRLGDEQALALQTEHPGISAAVWRGRHADDPDSPDPDHPDKFLPMCQRSDEARELEKALLDVDHHLCKQGRGKKKIECPLFNICAYQGQKDTTASVWFAAHEMMMHAIPKAFFDVGLVMIDESPLDAFTFGIDREMALALDNLLSDVAGPALKAKQLKMWGWHDMRRRSAAGRDKSPLSYARKKLHKALGKLLVPINPHLGVPVPYQSLGDLPNNAREFHQLEWREKITPDIKPNMDSATVEEKLTEANDNHNVKKKVTLWELIEKATPDQPIGRIQMQRGEDGRMIRMVGLQPIVDGWNVQTLICDATGDTELLRAIWPQLVEFEPRGWEQMPRPKSVRIFQVVDRSISKWAVAIEGKKKGEMERKIKAARRMYAAVLVKALEYEGAEVALIVYKSTKEWIKKNCYVPPWLKLMHHGATTGTNILEKVRALFVVGRPMADPEDVTRITEALFGDFIPERAYLNLRKSGRIPIVHDETGKNVIFVDARVHRDPRAERVRRQVTEAAQIQTEGRARAGLRSDSELLDIYRLHDVPLPELGPIEPVLWSEVDAGLDGLMLAAGGVWFESDPDAVEAYPDLFTLDGLKAARRRGRCVSLIRILY